MSKIRQTEIEVQLRAAGMGPRLARQLGLTIDNAIDQKGTKEILEALRDVQNRLERIEKKLEAEQ